MGIHGDIPASSLKNNQFMIICDKFMEICGDIPPRRNCNQNNQINP